jgi:hypothetical protein
MSQEEVTTEEVQQELPLESEETPTEEVVETPETGTEEVPEEPQYTPNYGFTSMDKEYEFDEFVRDAIKDEETEKKVRELYEKAYGLDHVKGKFEKASQEITGLREYETKYNNIDQSLKNLSRHVQNGDFDTFFNSLNIPEENIYAWVQKKIQEADLPEEHRTELERARESQKRAMLLEQENQRYAQQIEQQEVQARTFELEQSLTRPEIMTFATEYDARAGQAGAFKAEVIRQGQLEYHTSGYDIPVSEAIKRTMDHYGKFVQVQEQGQQAQPTTPQPAAQPAQQKPIIPNVEGKASSPIKQGPRSLEELRQLANSM